MNSSGKNICNLRLICNEFYKFFTKVGYKLKNQAAKTKIDSSNYAQQNYDYTDTLSSSSKSFCISPIEAEEITQNLAKLNTNIVHGLSQTPIKYTKKAENIISPFLADIYNKCIEQGHFPSELKISKLTAVYKTGQPELMTNGRPISVLSPFAKIFEKLLY